MPNLKTEKNYRERLYDRVVDEAFGPNLDTFKNFGLYEGKKVIENLSQSSSLAGFLEQIKFLKEDVTIQPIFRAWAGASGIITEETYKYFEKINR